MILICWCVRNRETGIRYIRVFPLLAVFFFSVLFFLIFFININEPNPGEKDNNTIQARQQKGTFATTPSPSLPRAAGRRNKLSPLAQYGLTVLFLLGGRRLLHRPSADPASWARMRTDGGRGCGVWWDGWMLLPLPKISSGTELAWMGRAADVHFTSHGERGGGECMGMDGMADGFAAALQQ